MTQRHRIQAEIDSIRFSYHKRNSRPKFELPDELALGFILAILCLGFGAVIFYLT